MAENGRTRARSGPASRSPARAGAARLSKSRFVAGLQCEKQLWWRVHEPDAPELVPDDSQARVLAQGSRVGELARRYVPGGVLIDLPYRDKAARIAATKRALADGAKVVYEASFAADGVFVSVDVLERRRGAFVLAEVKSSTSVKEEHYPDVAIQLHVLRRAGLDVRHAELMHLNRSCRFPDLSKLFVRARITPELDPWLTEIPAKIRALQRVLDGSVPERAPGPHCRTPYECPFRDRCWPAPPKHPIESLYRLGAARSDALRAQGITSLRQLPRDYPATGPAERQLRSVRGGELIVEPSLRRALAALKPPFAYLDFETIAPAIPVWPGCAPYDAVPVQMSVHRASRGGRRHDAWLADGPLDPRVDLALALLESCADARTILAYNAPFEQRCIDALASAVPRRARELRALRDRVVDLLPIVRDHVYHPDFGGSFSLKSVLPALVPELSYDDLAIRDGNAASSALEALLFAGPELEPAARAVRRAGLLRYCERDTLALARLHEWLREASATP